MREDNEYGLFNRHEQNEKTIGVSSTSECEDCQNITIPISTAVTAHTIHSIVSAAVDIGIVIFRQSSHSDMLFTLTVFSF